KCPVYRYWHKRRNRVGIRRQTSLLFLCSWTSTGRNEYYMRNESCRRGDRGGSHRARRSKGTGHRRGISRRSLRKRDPVCHERAASYGDCKKYGCVCKKRSDSGFGFPLVSYTSERNKKGGYNKS